MQDTAGIWGIDAQFGAGVAWRISGKLRASCGAGVVLSGIHGIGWSVKFRLKRIGAFRRSRKNPAKLKACFLTPWQKTKGSGLWRKS